MMILITRYPKRLLLIETTALFVIVILCVTIGYLTYLKPTLTQYLFVSHRHQTLQLKFAEQKTLALINQKTIRALQQWQHNHPNFFNVIQRGLTRDQSLQTITQMAQHAGFSIKQIQPITIAARLKKQKAQYFIQLKLAGHYQNFFDLLNQLMQSPWPLALTQLKISSVDQFNLQIEAWGFGDSVSA